MRNFREGTMAQANTEPRPLLPALQPFYEAVIPLSWLVVRIAVGWNLLVHGYPKLLNGSNDAILKAFADLGYNPPALWFWASAGIETFGRRLAHPGAVHTVFCRGCRHRDAVHHHNVLEQWFRLDAPRLRIRAAVGAVVLCHRAARRRTVLARSQAWARAIRADSHR